MMIVPMLAWAAMAQGTAPRPVRLGVGDVVSVYVATADKEPFTRYTTVLSDGAIYGVGFGKLKVAGMTVEQAQAALRVGMRKFFKEDDVFFTLIQQRKSFVYVVGSEASGPVELPTDGGVTLGQLLPPIKNGSDAQRLDVQLVRGGKVVGRTSYLEAASGRSALGRTPILPNDLLSVVPQASVRVWVVGPVKSSGQQILPAGVSIYQAVAAAGGVSSFESTTRLVLRHGPETTEYPARPSSGQAGPALEDGDVVTVVAPEPIHVTVSGQVNKATDLVVDSGTTLLQAISRAEGPSSVAALGRVFVFRNGEALQYDLGGLRSGSRIDDPRLREGDVVYVDENRNGFYVFGHVQKNGRFTMDEGRTYRVTDALAASGGLDPRGSLRRVYLYRANPDGRPTITQINLDEYLKDGKQAANPELRPGDAVLFSEPKGLTLAALNQAFSAFFVINALRR